MGAGVTSKTDSAKEVHGSVRFGRKNPKTEYAKECKKKSFWKFLKRKEKE